MKPIEQRIKPLVDILNTFPFVKTFSSCEGHFTERDPTRHNAHVLFYVSGEELFLPLGTRILAHTAPFWHEFSVELYKRFYVLPGETTVYTHYGIRIEPFLSHERKLSSVIQRKITDTGICCVIETIRAYKQDFEELML